MNSDGKKKIFVVTDELKAFLDVQSVTVQQRFHEIVEVLEKDGFLALPYGKKLSGYPNLFEIRILSGGNVRVFYCYFEAEYVVGVSGFIKKSMKTPKKGIQKALKLIKKLEV